MKDLNVKQTITGYYQNRWIPRLLRLLYTLMLDEILRAAIDTNIIKDNEAVKFLSTPLRISIMLMIVVFYLQKNRTLNIFKELGKVL